METMINNTNQQLEAAKTATQEWRAALQEAEASRKARKQTILDAIVQHETELEALADQKKNLETQLAEALMTADTEKAEDLRVQMVEIEKQADETQAKIDALNNYDIVAAEEEKIDVAVEKLQTAYTATHTAKEAASALVETIKSEIEKLEKALKEAEAERRSLDSWRYAGGNMHYEDSDVKLLISLYESAKGELDVTGHSCDSDFAAKMRFLCGSTRGIERTPAITGGGSANTQTRKSLRTILGHSDEV